GLTAPAAMTTNGTDAALHPATELGVAVELGHAGHYNVSVSSGTLGVANDRGSPPVVCVPPGTHVERVHRQHDGALECYVFQPLPAHRGGVAGASACWPSRSLSRCKRTDTLSCERSKRASVSTTASLCRTTSGSGISGGVLP